jgi:predicted metal-dependent hydrolase
MAKDKAPTEPTSVTMRVRVGDAEIEITGPPQFAKAEINEFLKRSPSVGEPTKNIPPAPPSPPTLKAKSPAEFFKMSNPKTDVDRTLAAAYFLEKYRNAQDASAAEIRDVIKEAKRPPPTNINDSVNGNIRKGFIMMAGDRENKMVFVLTSDGEAAVEQMVANSKP